MPNIGDSPFSFWAVADHPTPGGGHQSLRLFAGPVLEDGRNGTRALTGRLTMTGPEAAVFIELVNGRERHRLRNARQDRILAELRGSLSPQEKLDLATGYHAAHCVGCGQAPHGEWLELALSVEAMRLAEAELT